LIAELVAKTELKKMINCSRKSIFQQLSEKKCLETGERKSDK
jgi:hypothetical protein